uniref:ATP synthase subunit a n=1 Tax=Dictyla platyoma TaxID=2172477 RepID=A0A343WNM7_9HEMI|nr:ATP synthase F0 subunit 6 [Dictyla platyoma]AWD31603.1 ATP synthase F0 subunit 6 [Dictyla platyoma]
MMNNLFSTFDPSTSMKLSTNWISMLLLTSIIPMKFWIKNSRIYNMMFIIMNVLNKELKMSLNNKSKEIIVMMLTLFMFILINNLMGLLPYIFTATSHMSVNMSMALPMWLSIMLFGWIKKTKMMLVHLTPLGTPEPLMPFMVMIEMISNMIRPISLSVRLTANMITGHLLMTLLETSMTINNTPVLLMQLVLMTFETAVAFIQAYVFMMLMTLYISEVNYDNT